MNPRFLLAKYVPDLSRMEPRNIGVFLWANGEIAERFLPTSAADFVGDPETYEWWVSSWREAISGVSIEPVRGQTIKKADPRCMDALLTRQENNFLLVDAGELLEPIGKRELNEAVDFLYGDLVAQAKTEEVVAAHRSGSTLRDYCDRIFRSTGIADRPDYHEGYKIEVPVYGVRRHLSFNHGLGNGTPNAIFQQANLRNQQSVNSSALMIYAVTNYAVLPKSRCAALAKESDVSNDAASEGLAQLQELCRVIFVDRNDADEQIREVALNGVSAGARRSRRT